MVAVLKTDQEEISWGKARHRTTHEKAVTVTPGAWTQGPSVQVRTVSILNIGKDYEKKRAFRPEQCSSWENEDYVWSRFGESSKGSLLNILNLR